MAKPLEKHVVEKVKELLLLGLSHPKIMEQTGVSRITICRYSSALKKGEKTKREINKEERTSPVPSPCTTARTQYCSLSHQIKGVTNRLEKNGSLSVRGN